MLENYQVTLMKPYFDAGLKSQAKAAGYPTEQIQSCGQFKRTHTFLLEAWEATYQAMLALYLEAQDHNSSQILSHQLRERIIQSLHSLSQEDFSKAFNERLANISATIGHSLQGLKGFLEWLGNKDETRKFWTQFVIEDAMAYLGLFLAISSGDWHLRLASMKLMASVFTAFNHPTYQG